MIERVSAALDVASAILAEAVAGGVTDVVLCPGSRSAPFAYAALAAQLGGTLRLHVRVDERSAGFLALGLAKVSRRPALVITTSGTAVANLHPAVLEAHHGHVPLIVISADRPAHLRGTGANQTTLQPGMFGTALRHEIDLMAEETTECAAAAISAAISAATAHDPGPVHLNVCLGEPLVPSSWPLPGVPGSAARAGARQSEQPGGPAPESPSIGVPQSIPDIERTLVVLGDLVDGHDRPSVSAWARLRDYPLIAEPFGLRHNDIALPHGPLLLTVTSWLDAHAPERVLVVGRVTLSRPVTALLRRADVQVAAITDLSWTPDPVGVVGSTFPLAALLAEVATTSASLGVAEVSGVPEVSGSAEIAGTNRHAQLAEAAEAAEVSEVAEMNRPAGPAGGTWSAQWRDASRRVARAVGGLAGDSGRGPGNLEGEVEDAEILAGAWGTGLAVAATVANALPEGATLIVGPSNSVRDLDLGAAGFADGVQVLANRGLAGIDGVLSTAIGIALSMSDETGAGSRAGMNDETGTGRTTGMSGGKLPERGEGEGEGASVALVGDLTFLHDTNALLIGPHEERPDLTIVVINDDGGGIFTLLEPGAPQRQPAFERVFGTPTGTDIAALCRAHGIPHRRIGSAAQLRAELGAAPRGIRVLEVPLERTGHRAAHARLREVAAVSLATAP